LDNPKVGNAWLGSYCGQVPEMFNGILPASVNVKNLTLLSSCAAPDTGNGTGTAGTDTDTSRSASCSMQNIVYVYYPGAPGVSYSVSKSQIGSVMQKLRSVYDSATVCSKADIQYLVDSGLPYCACGWITDGNGGYTSVYPSTLGTSRGCGGGSQSVISCGDDGPSWASGKAGIYVRITAPPDEVMTKLKTAGFGGAVVATVGKNEYSPLAGTGERFQVMPAPPPPPPPPPPAPPAPPNPANYQMYGIYIGSGGQSLPVQKTLMEGKTIVFMIHDGPYTKIVKQAPNGDQEGYYYVGQISQYGTKALNKQSKGGYNIRKIR
jgi:hypothetical protein